MRSSYFRNLILLALLLVFVCRADDPAPGADDDDGDGLLPPQPELPQQDDEGQKDGEEAGHLGSKKIGRVGRWCYWGAWQWWFNQPKCRRGWDAVHIQCRRWWKPIWNIVVCNTCGTYPTIASQAVQFVDAPSGIHDGPGQFSYGHQTRMLTFETTTTTTVVSFPQKRCQCRYLCCRHW